MAMKKAVAVWFELTGGGYAYEKIENHSIKQVADRLEEWFYSGGEVYRAETANAVTLINRKHIVRVNVKEDGK